MTYAAGYAKGQLNTSDLAPNLAQLSFAKAYYRLIPGGTAKIAGMLGMLPTGTAVQPEHFYYTKSMVFPACTTTATALVGATSLTVDSTAQILPNMVLQNFRTQEAVLVTAVVDAVTLTIVRAFGSTAAAAVNNADYFAQVGTAFEEGSSRPIAASINVARIPNYCQIFRNSWALTGTLGAVENIAGDGNISESRRDCMEFHMADMEKSIIFGEALSGGTAIYNSKPIRKMDGIISMIKKYAPTNIATAGSTTSYSQLEGLLDPVFDTQSDPKIGTQRILLVGSQALKTINKIGRLSGQYQIVNSETDFGLQFSTFRMSRGEFKMIEHPLFNTNPNWKKMALAVDISSMKMMFLPGRNTKAENFGINGQYVENGLDAVGGSLLTEATLEFKHPAANAVVYNLTDGAAG